MEPTDRGLSCSARSEPQTKATKASFFGFADDASEAAPLRRRSSRNPREVTTYSRRRLRGQAAAALPIKKVRRTQASPESDERPHPRHAAVGRGKLEIASRSLGD